MVKKIDYRTLSQELEVIMSQLQDGSLDIDEATAKYDRAISIISELEAYISVVDNKITKIKSTKKT